MNIVLPGMPADPMNSLPPAPPAAPNTALATVIGRPLCIVPGLANLVCIRAVQRALGGRYSAGLLPAHVLNLITCVKEESEGTDSPLTEAATRGHLAAGLLSEEEVELVVLVLESLFYPTYQNHRLRYPSEGVSHQAFQNGLVHLAERLRFHPSVATTLAMGYDRRAVKLSIYWDSLAVNAGDIDVATGATLFWAVVSDPSVYAALGKPAKVDVLDGVQMHCSGSVIEAIQAASTMVTLPGEGQMIIPTDR